jgi:hypothetical protein
MAATARANGPAAWAGGPQEGPDYEVALFATEVSGPKWRATVPTVNMPSGLIPEGMCVFP